MNREASYKTITSVPGWTDLFATQGKVNDTAAAFSMVPLVYRCTNIICDALSSVPLIVHAKGDIQGTPKELPFEFDHVEWSWKSAAAHLLTGASYSVILKNKVSSRIIKGLQWVNPYGMTVQKNSAGDYFFQSGSQTWGKEEILYSKEFNPVDDILPGKSAVGVALNDAGLVRYITTFASKYFETGAMPVTIMPIPQGTSDTEQKRVEGIFKQMMTGINNAFRVIALRTNKELGNPYKMTPDLNTMSMDEIDDRARRAITSAFGVPVTMVEDAANFATAKEHRLSFWQDTVRPRGVRLQNALNKQLLFTLGLEARYDFESMDIFQEDESQRAASLKQLTDSGLDILTACEILGYDLTDEQIARLQDKKPEPVAPIVVQTPPEKEEEVLEPEEKTYTSADTRSALFNWKAAVLAAVKTGHDPDIDFDHPAIPEMVMLSIHEGLKECKAADDVHAVFKQARESIKAIEQPVEVTGLINALNRASELSGKMLEYTGVEQIDGSRAVNSGYIGGE